MSDDDPNAPQQFDLSDLPEPPELSLGEPWAIAHDCELLRKSESGQLLTCAVITCGGCEKPFRVDLLDDRVKSCPHCKERYTHVLLVANVDNYEIAPQAFEQIARMNGFGDPQQNDEHTGEGEGEQQGEPETPDT